MNIDINNLVHVTTQTEAGLAQYIHDEMPDGSPSTCEDECASDIAAYMWSYVNPVIINLVSNGEFETDTSGWYTWNSTTISATADEANSGLMSMLATDRPDNAGHAATNLTSVVSAGNSYSVSAYVMIGGTEQGVARASAVVECADPEPVDHNTYPWVANNGDVTPNTWTLLSGTINIPADCIVEGVQLYFEGTAAGVDVYIDDVMVTLD